MTAAGMINTTAPDTVQQAALGDEMTVAGTRYGYYLASGALAVYSVCTVNSSYVAVVGTTTTSGARPTQFCIPQFAVADGEYFWAPIGPIRATREDGSTAFKVLAALNCAKDVKLYTTGTDGVVDDSATDLIAGLSLTETITTAAAATCIAVCRMVSNCQD